MGVIVVYKGIERGPGGSPYHAFVCTPTGYLSLTFGFRGFFDVFGKQAESAVKDAVLEKLAEMSPDKAFSNPSIRIRKQKYWLPADLLSDGFMGYRYKCEVRERPHDRHTVGDAPETLWCWWWDKKCNHHKV